MDRPPIPLDRLTLHRGAWCDSCRGVMPGFAVAFPDGRGCDDVGPTICAGCISRAADLIVLGDEQASSPPACKEPH